MKHLCVVSFIIITLSGCSIRITSNKAHDGGVFRSTDYGETWQQRVFVRQEKKKVTTISDIGVASIISAPGNPEELTITTYDGGVYRTSNGTEQWNLTQLSSGTYSDFAYDATNPATQYAATGSMIMKSMDGGDRWERIYTETRGETITAVVVDSYDPSRVYAGTNGGTLLKSANAGINWASLFDVNDTVLAITPLPQDTRTIYVTTANKGVYRSMDTGTTWQQLEGLMHYSGAGQIHQLLLAGGTRNMYVATSYGLLRSDDGGTSWTPIKTLVPFGTVPIQTVAIDPRAPSVIYFSVNNLIHKSEDNGATWRTISVPTRRLITRLVINTTKDGELYLGTRKVKK